MRILLLADDRRNQAANVREHIRALRRLSRHDVALFNPMGLGHSRLLRFDDYDVVVVHYTIFVLYDSYLSPWFREQIADFAGLKVQFIQDEYRSVDTMTARMRELGIDLVFSSLPREVVPLVYGPRLAGVDIVPTLTGYVPAVLEGRPLRALADRQLDVVYRGRSTPYWLGRFGQEKVRIGSGFLARVASTDLRCDIAWSEASRIYGEAWYRFLGSSRTTLGTESGASIVDFDGSVRKRTESYLRVHPAATFEEVEREVLAPFEDNVPIHTVSPRVFEAAALGTAMVNFTGRYSDILEPWTHYIPLEKDFSNFDDVLPAIRDDGMLERIASRAQADLVASGRYSLPRFVHDFESELQARMRPGPYRPRSPVFGTVNRPLLVLDQLRSPLRRDTIPFWPGPKVARTAAALRAVLTSKELRRLVRAYLRSPQARAEAPLDVLLKDLQRLRLVEQARTSLELDATRNVLFYRTDTGSPSEVALDPATIQSLELIIWDHSAVGSLVTSEKRPRITVILEDGRYEFQALSRVARRFPNLAAPVLQRPGTSLGRKRPVGSHS